MKRSLSGMFAVLVLLTLTIGTVMADPEFGAASEFAYYDGQVYELRAPSADSNNSNQFIFSCFNLGPDFNEIPAGPTATIYAVIAPGTSLDSCPDGTDIHDHVITAVPGTPGYTGKWNLEVVVAGPNFDPSIMPVTSQQDLLAALDAGQLLKIPFPSIVFMAPVIGLAE